MSRADIQRAKDRLRSLKEAKANATGAEKKAISAQIAQVQELLDALRKARDADDTGGEITPPDDPSDLVDPAFESAQAQIEEAIQRLIHLGWSEERARAAYDLPNWMKTRIANGTLGENSGYTEVQRVILFFNGLVEGLTDEQLAALASDALGREVTLNEFDVPRHGNLLQPNRGLPNFAIGGVYYSNDDPNYREYVRLVQGGMDQAEAAAEAGLVALTPGQRININGEIVSLDDPYDPDRPVYSPALRPGYTFVQGQGVLDPDGNLAGTVQSGGSGPFDETGSPTPVPSPGGGGGGGDGTPPTYASGGGAVPPVDLFGPNYNPQLTTSDLPTGDGSGAVGPGQAGGGGGGDPFTPVDPLADERLAQIEAQLAAKQQDLATKQARLEHWQAKLETETDPAKITNIQNNIARLTDQIAKLETQIAQISDVRLPKAEIKANRLNYYETAQTLMPYLPSELLMIYTNAWVDTGDPELAMATVVSSPKFNSFFPGLKRDDGTLRMTILEYIGTLAGYEDTLFDAGVSPEVFRHLFGDLIAGEVSTSEFAARIRAVEENIIEQEPELAATYARFYGLEMTRAALLASAIDPNLGQQVIDRQVSVAEIGGEAALQKFLISRDKATALFHAGFDQASAQGLFRQAGQFLVPLSRAATRFNEGPFDLDAFLDAQAFSEVGATQRISRILTSEASLFTQAGTDVRRDEATRAIGGLSPR